jgi:hypothetical protein
MMDNVPPPVCRCLSCGSEFTVRPHVEMDSVSSYAERLSKVICFNCGASSGLATSLMSLVVAMPVLAFILQQYFWIYAESVVIFAVIGLAIFAMEKSQ